MTCKFCGNEINEGADVCFICGQPVEKPAEAPQPEQPAPAEPVYSEPAPVAAQPSQYSDQPQPVVAPQPVAYQQPPQATPYPETPQGGKAKKSKVKDPNKVGKFLLFICALLPFVGAIVYAKNKKNDVRKVQIANATFVGLDIWLAVICVIFFVKFMLK